MATKLDGIADKLVEALAKTAKDIAQAAYHQAGVTWEQGWIEAANAVFPGSNIPLPQAITTNSLARNELLGYYETQLNTAHERAVEQQEPQHEIEK